MCAPLPNPMYPPLRDKIMQHPERSRPELADAILQQGYVVHVAYQEAGQPYVIPMSYHYTPAVGEQPACVYLHGSPKSHLLQVLASGQPVCLEVTQLEGLVYSRTAKFHSMNYRSVVAFGQGRELQDLGRKYQLLADMITRLYPGRQLEQDYFAGPEGHWEHTFVVEIPLQAVTVKSREGGPKGPEDSHPFAAGNAGVTPLQPVARDWRPQSWQQPPFWVSDETSKLQPARIFELLAPTYWSEGLTPERLALRMQHSLCFGLYHESEQIGFARLTTDHDSFAYLQDMVVAPQWRGQGLGKFLIRSIQAHPVMQRVRWALLSTRDAQPFYAQLDWQPHQAPQKLMVYQPAGAPSAFLTQPPIAE